MRGAPYISSTVSSIHTARARARDYVGKAGNSVKCSLVFVLVRWTHGTHGTHGRTDHTDEPHNHPNPTTHPHDHARAETAATGPGTGTGLFPVEDVRRFRVVDDGADDFGTTCSSRFQVLKLSQSVPYCLCAGEKRGGCDAGS